MALSSSASSGAQDSAAGRGRVSEPVRRVTSGGPRRGDDIGVIGAVFALALPLAAPAAAAPKPTLPPTPPAVAARMSGLFASATPAVRRWVDAEARKLRALPQIDAVSVAADARAGFPAARPALTQGQSDVLASMALYQVLNDLDSELRLALGDTTPAGRAATLDRRAKLVQTLSSLLAKIAKTDESIVQNLK